MHFINSPLGVVCLLVILVTALINIYAHWIEDGLVGRMLYMALAFTSVAGLIRYTSASIPEHLASTLVVIYSLMAVRNITVRSTRYFKYRRNIHAKNNQR